MSDNRSYWNANSDAYQAEHGAVLDETALAWGVWRIPEADLKVLGDVRGRDVLELGCGAAQWSRALRKTGVRAVGLDPSERQLAHAHADHGAMLFGAPAATVPEAARVLRRGGLLAFCMSTPVRHMFVDARGNFVGIPSSDYFTLSTFDDGEGIEHQLPYGAWIRLFRQHGLVVEDLVELHPPPTASTTYEGYVPLEWASRWPAEHIWKLRKS